MTPAEKMEDAVLKEMGLTKDDLQTMDPQQRAKVEQEVTEKIREKMKEQMQDKAAGAQTSATVDDV
jgi:hypothetical protein